jgi:TadE-like protein
MKLLRSIKKDEEGAALVEFALCFPLILITFGMGVDFGYESFVRTVSVGTVQEVARKGSFEAGSVGKVEKRVRDVLGKYTKPENITITMRNFREMSKIATPELVTKDVGLPGYYFGTGDCWQDSTENGQYDKDQQGTNGLGKAESSVEYTMTAKFPRLLGMTTILLGLVDALSPTKAETSAGINKHSKYFNVEQKVIVQREPFEGVEAPPVVCK